MANVHAKLSCSAVISASAVGLTDKFQRFRRLSRSLDYQLGSSRTIRTVLVNQTLDINQPWIISTELIGDATPSHISAIDTSSHGYGRQ